MPTTFITSSLCVLCLSVFVCWIIRLAKETNHSSVSSTNYFCVDNNYRPYFECKDIKDITVLTKLAEGVVKDVYIAKWNFSYVVLSKLKHNIFESDFHHNILMLRSFRKSPFITQFIGNCSQENILLTKYYPLGNALNFPFLLKKGANSGDVCFKMCVSFVQIMNYLHNSPIGVRVMCDSNSLSKLLSQFLITNSWRLVANDLDALPLVTEKGIKCGHREIKGTFVAPEQLWPFSGKPFNESEMPEYNEKVDIWKIADVCNWFLSFCSVKQSLINDLKEIHFKCKSRDANERPSASNILELYERTAAKHNISDAFIYDHD